MLERDVRQWIPGEISLEAIVDQVRRDEWFVMGEADRVVAAAQVLVADEDVWGQRPPGSLYVHGLVVDRRLNGQGLGRLLLDWIEHRAVAMGLNHVRLDCVEHCLRLRAYYRDAGFVEVGRNDLDGRWFPVTLLEKHLSRVPPAVSTGPNNSYSAQVERPDDVGVDGVGDRKGDRVRQAECA
jgi:GNAT superfamily N-acetyltransferase